MLDDQSKKFIQDTIENAIDRKFDEQGKQTQAKQKLDDLHYEKRALEDRKKLLEELQQRDKKGENTIAQKFEMMNLAITNAIPQDVTKGLKDAYASGAKTVKNGANQIGAGLSHLTQRAMLSNPITAFLYNNRDILGALGDVGIGAAKMGWGAVKGVGQGALSLANSAVNMFKRSKNKNNEEEEETEETGLSKLNPFTGNEQEGPSFIEKLTNEKENWQKQIDEIHKIITKDLIKQQKTASTQLSKGLSGLGATMKAIQGFTDMIVAKQKLILGGVLLGAIAIFGLAAWFKNGGLLRLLRQGVDNVNKKNIQGAEQQADNAVNIYNSGNLKDGGIDLANQKVQKGSKITQVGSAEKISTEINDAKKGLVSKTEKDYQNNGASQSTAYLLAKKGLGALNTVSKRQFSNDSKSITKIAFPVAVNMLAVEFDKKQENCSILLEKAQVTKGVEERLKYATRDMPKIIISNVVKLFIPKNKVIQPNTTLCHVGPDYQIWGDLDEFLRGETYQNYTNKQMQNYSTIDNNYKQQFKDKNFQKQLVKSEQQAVKQTSRNVGVAKTTQSLLQKTGDKIVELMGNSDETQENPTIDNSANQQKQQEQQQKINEQQKQNKQQKTDKKAEALNNDRVASINLSNSNTTPYRYADLLNTGEYNNMVNEDIIT